jgi:hypothetical protein
VRRLAQSAPAFLESHPPLEALRAWMDQLARYGMTKVGLGDALYLFMDGLRA